MMHQKSKKLLVFDKLKRKLRNNIRNYKYLNYIPVVCIIFLLFGLVYGVVFVNDNQSEAYADGDIMTLAEATASLTVGGSDSVNLSSNTTPGNVAYAATNVNYTATDVTNYTVKVSYANGSSSLKGLSTGATTIGNAGNKAPSAMGDNTWGYAWTDTGKTTETDYAGLNYQTMPAYNSGVTVASGNSSITNGSGRIVFAAKFGSTAATGHYQTKVLVALAATPAGITYTLNFDANGGTGVPAAQSCTTASASDTSCTITLSTTMPNRTNYDFLGWSNTKPANTTTATANTNYSPGKTNFALSSSSPTTLYAVWRAKVSTSSGFTSITNMQQMTSSICSSAATGASKSLTDTRSGNYSYTVTKLADGKCWVTQNLRLGSTTGTLTLTSSDSNVTSNYTLPQAITSGGFDSTQSGSYYTNQQVYIQSSTLSTKGAYYSHNAATANSIASSSSGTASQDICPKNWRLPTKDEYVALASALSANDDRAGSAIIRGTPNNFVCAGYVYTSGLSDSSTYGRYWSSTIASATIAYTLSFSSTSITPSGSNYRYYGYSVRCVAKESSGGGEEPK